ncbi:response regulator [Labilibaculum manganireducens]|uniref:LytR/AlgR family response regulator transcription factor n=1 Tax=Labilibaculum manganireducens TaxID=1940525 RepID=UPI0029F4C4D0|nr:response regulator [Labilibaculum manganireducens]
MIQLNYIAVDDEPIFLKELNRHLSTYPFLNELDLISDPFEAIEIINSKKPDIVFLDHDMPGINGRDVLKAINFKSQIVFITSNFTPIQEVINHDGIASIQGYLSKPISKEELKNICLKLNSTIKKKTSAGRISIPNGKKEAYYFDLFKLSCVKADEKYTIWHFIDSPSVTSVNLLLKDAKQLLRDKGVEFIEANRSYIIFENGIKMKKHRDIIVNSNGDDIEISIGEKDKDGFFSWLKRKFR